MGKYIVNMNNTTYLQTAVRQLVHMNVLLKKSSDKNGEEKRQLRKKLQQVEKSQSEKDKFLASKEKEIQELRETLADAEAECERLKRGEAKKPSSKFRLNTSRSNRKLSWSIFLLVLQFAWTIHLKHKLSLLLGYT